VRDTRRNIMATVKDPVCGMEIDSSSAVAQASYEGQDFYFCSQECHETFMKDPGQYLVTGAEHVELPFEDPYL
jgi:YHS domain-containing protein